MFNSKNPHRSWLILGVILTLGLIITACGGPAAPPPQATTAPAGGTQPTTVPAAGGAPVKLRFWMQQDNLLQQAMTGIITSFQKDNPNIQIQLEAFPFADYHNKLGTAFAGGDPPDVFWMDIRTAQFAQQGALLPLDQYITDDNRKDFLPESWKDPTYQGKVYGIPMHELTEALYVNTQMATDAGVTLPKTVDTAWTWQQFEDAAKKMTKRSGDTTSVWGFGVQRQLQDWSVLPIVYQHGANVFSSDLKKTTGFLNGTATVEAQTWYGNLFTQSKVASVEVIPNGFQTGKYAIYQAPSSFRPVLDNNFPDLKYTIVPMFKDKQCSVMTGGWNVSIAASTKNAKEAWLLIDYLTRVKHADWVNNSGYLPVRKSLMDTAKFKDYPWNIFIEELSKCAANRPATSKYTFFSDVYKQSVTDIATGKPAQATLDTAAQKIDAELAR